MNATSGDTIIPPNIAKMFKTLDEKYHLLGTGDLISAIIVLLREHFAKRAKFNSHYTQLDLEFLNQLNVLVKIMETKENVIFTDPEVIVNQKEDKPDTIV